VCRFLYLPVLSGAEGSKEGDFTFRAYPLTDDKSFDNFFHPEKEEVLHLVRLCTSPCYFNFRLKFVKFVDFVKLGQLWHVWFQQQHVS
jgi:hypothetical protein